MSSLSAKYNFTITITCIHAFIIIGIKFTAATAATSTTLAAPPGVGPPSPINTNGVPVKENTQGAREARPKKGGQGTNKVDVTAEKSKTPAPSHTTTATTATTAATTTTATTTTNNNTTTTAAGGRRGLEKSSDGTSADSTAEGVGAIPIVGDADAIQSTEKEAATVVSVPADKQKVEATKDKNPTADKNTVPVPKATSSVPKTTSPVPRKTVSPVPKTASPVPKTTSPPVPKATSTQPSKLNATAKEFKFNLTAPSFKPSFSPAVPTVVPTPEAMVPSPMGMGPQGSGPQQYPLRMGGGQVQQSPSMAGRPGQPGIGTSCAVLHSITQYYIVLHSIT